ncbi:MAG: N-acetylmuramoyl-L-alanine amidase [Synergistaceae bacterium]|nr:N-acetylmuramoyl-L-alanine amidase [Synergistaceae bacterium]
MRALFSLLLTWALLFFLIPAVPSEAGMATLYRGSIALGQVPVIDGEMGFALSVADAGALLGLNASTMGEELVLSRGDDSLRIVLNAVAAWYNNQLAPLYGPCYAQDGKWWLDVSSALSLFQHFVGRGPGDRLSVEEVQSLAAPNPPPTPVALLTSTETRQAASQQAPLQQVVAPGEIRAVRWSFSKEKIRAVVDCNDGTNPELRTASGKVSMLFSRTVPIVSGVPSPYENVKADLVKNADGSALLSFTASGVQVEKLVLNEPRRIVLDFVFTSPTAVREVVILEAPVAAREAKNQDPPPALIENPILLPETRQTTLGQTVVPSSERTGGASAEAAVSANASGEIRAVRWSFSKEKIRAVVDCSDGTNPDVKVESSRFSMAFSRTTPTVPGVPSPYENVKVDLAKNADGSALLTFTASGARIEKLVLNEPRRIVLDFIFNTPMTVREVAAPATPAVARETVVRETPGKKGKLLVVLDPGHGGNDPGAVSNGLREKDINLAIGLKMEKSLKDRGFDVKMTRSTDVYLKLQERTDFANRADADMFVSIHVNSLPPGKNSAGFEIYLMALPTDQDALTLAKIENREYTEDKAESGAASDRRTELVLKILGDMLANEKINESTAAAEALYNAGNVQGLPMKRVAQAPFFVLRGAGMPAVLLETGFITNAKEAKLLAHSGYQQKLADAMADGIKNYFK